MDDARFDWLARQLGSWPTSRRALLVGVAGLLPLGDSPSVAASCRTLNESCTTKAPGIGKRRKCCAGLVCRQRRCRVKECSGFLGCGKGRGCCAGVCVDLQTDEANCGQCGKDCGDGGTCLGGRCVALGCAALREPCASPDGCCQPVVGEGMTCASITDTKGPRGCGFVTLPGDPPDRCCLSGGGYACTGDCDCCGNLSCCDGTCVDLAQDPFHCGNCATKCPQDRFCCEGGCHVPGDCNGCPNGRCVCREVGTPCETEEESAFCCGADQGRARCAYVDFDKGSGSDGLRECVGRSGVRCCRSDGQPCGSDCECCGRSTCRQGVCTGVSDRCPAGLTLCDFNCVDTQSNPDHCGVCGHACAAGEACQGGRCARTSCLAVDQFCTPGGTPCCPPYPCALRTPSASYPTCTYPCVAYGQSCVSDTQAGGPWCCDDVPCIGGLCRYT